VPGHSDDHLLLYESTHRVLITGDLLFVGKVGGTQTDEQARIEWRSLNRLLETIPGDATVWPGHDYGARPSSTCGAGASDESLSSLRGRGGVSPAQIRMAAGEATTRLKVASLRMNIGMSARATAALVAFFLLALPLLPLAQDNAPPLRCCHATGGGRFRSW
jgi:hypothetical protein